MGSNTLSEAVYAGGVLGYVGEYQRHGEASNSTYPAAAIDAFGGICRAGSTRIYREEPGKGKATSRSGRVLGNIGRRDARRCSRTGTVDRERPSVEVAIEGWRRRAMGQRSADARRLGEIRLAEA